MVHGKGLLDYPDGTRYIGTYKDGVLTGKVELRYPNDNVYIGLLKDGKPDGQGTLKFPNGYNYVGEFKNGESWNGKVYDENGKIFGKVVNGKRIKQ